MAETLRYALPLLQAGQAQKEVTHNDALGRIDSLLQLAVESRWNTAPPVMPADGTAWIVAAGATGAWQGHDGEIAAFDESGWTFIAPRDGCIAYLRDSDVFINHGAGTWRDGWPVSTLAIGGHPILNATVTAVSSPDGGTIVDLEARAAIDKLLAALRSLGIVVPA